MIKNIKVLHRACLLGHNKRYSPGFLSAINMFTDARKAFKPTTIVHCFKHIGFCASEEPVNDDGRLDHQEAEDISTALDVGESVCRPAEQRDGHSWCHDVLQVHRC